MAVNKDDEYYFDRLVSIQVEDTIFRVPRREFEEQSEVFANMFAMPSGTESEDGRCDKQPLHLSEITASDFRRFLKASFPRPVLQFKEALTDAELDVALRLAIMWCFDGFRKVLINQLEALKLPSPRKLQLARTHDIREWYKPELRELALRKPSLNCNEGVQLGPELAAMVSALRDERYNVIVRVRQGKPEPGEIEKCVDQKLREFSRARHWDPLDDVKYRRCLSYEEDDSN